MKTMEVLEVILRDRDVSKTTKDNYRIILTHLSKFSEEYPEKPSIINQYIASMTDYADTTKAIHFKTIKAISNYMNNVYDLPNAFTKGVIKPKVKPKDRRYWTKEEVLKIITSCKSDYERALILTLIDSACRIGELVNLKRKDIGEGFFYIHDTKTHGRQMKHLDINICRVLYSMGTDDESTVFGNGHKPTVANLKQIVRNIVIRAGITGDKLGAHTFRHTAGSVIAKNTKSLLAVQYFLGHTESRTSQGYIHDAESSVILDTVSPLQIIQSDIFGNETQHRLLTDGKEKSIDAEYQDITNTYTDFLPQIPLDISIRPKLNYNDLQLLKEIAEHYINTIDYNEHVGAIKQLFNRMLRRQKGEEQQ